MCIDEKSMTLFYYAKDCKDCKNWHHGTFVFGQTESGKIDWIQVAYKSLFSSSFDFCISFLLLRVRIESGGDCCSSLLKEDKKPCDDTFHRVSQLSRPHLLWIHSTNFCSEIWKKVRKFLTKHQYNNQ